MEFHAADPDIRMLLAARTDTTGRFEIPLPPLKYDIPYAVVVFKDSNRNNIIDRGEDFVGTRSEAAGYTGKGLFLVTDGGTLVGDRSWDLSEVDFVADVSL